LIEVNMLAQAIVLQFKVYEDPLTLARRVEVKAIDVKTHVPLTSLPPFDMATWLNRQGFRWLPGSSGIWERTALREPQGRRVSAERVACPSAERAGRHLPDACGSAAPGPASAELHIVTLAAHHRN
jgi:hypothetical protein